MFQFFRICLYVLYMKYVVVDVNKITKTFDERLKISRSIRDQQQNVSPVPPVNPSLVQNPVFNPNPVPVSRFPNAPMFHQFSQPPFPFYQYPRPQFQPVIPQFRPVFPQFFQMQQPPSQ